MQRAWVLLLLLPLAGCDKLKSIVGPSAPTGQCAGPQTYSIGSTVNSKLGENECSGPGDIAGHLYAITLTGQTNFSTSMAPSGFNGAFGVWTSVGKLVFEVSGSGTLAAQSFLPAGQYTLVAGRSGSSGGNYALTTQPSSTDGCFSGTTWTMPGATIVGSVTGNDCTGLGIVRQDIYEMWLASGQTVTVSATMDQAGFLSWFTGSSQLITQPVAKNGTASFTYTATSATTYRAHVMRDQGTQPINYTLSVR